MKFLFVDFTLPYLIKDAQYPVGGWAVQLSSWIKGLRADGHHVGVLTWKGANEFVSQDLDFDLIESYDPKKGIKILKYFYYYIPTLYKKTSSFAPDVIMQACAGLNTGIMAFIARRLDSCFIHRIANDVDADNRYREYLYKYEQLTFKYGLKRSDLILCQNKYQYNALSVQNLQNNTHILRNPFHFDNFTNITSFTKRTYIAWIGVFKKQKNLSLLYEIAQSCPEIIFNIAGMKGRNIDPETEAALKDLENLPNVQFMGYLSRTEVIPFLSGSIALLNTSIHEGFSNTYLEAFAVGTPVIAPEHADPDNIIHNNNLGFAVKDKHEFPAKIRELVSDQDTFDQISQRAQQYLHEHHDPQVLASKLVEIIQQCKGRAN